MISNYFRIAVGTAMIAMAVWVAPGAQAQDISCENPKDSRCDPCLMFQGIINLANGTLIELDDGVKGFINLLAPDVADLDGSFLIDDTGDSLVASLTGDDMRDVSNQMELLEYIMDNNVLGLTISSAEIEAAIRANLAEIKEKIGPETLSLLQLIKSVVPSLTFLTLIGKDSDFAVIENPDPIKTHGQGTLGILQALLVLLSGVELNDKPLTFADTTVSPGDFITFGDRVGADGDLDGDGYSNLCEYRHFKKNLCSSRFANPAPDDNALITFFQAVTNPLIIPIGCYEVETAADDCTFPLTGDAVVPPSGNDARGQVRVRRLENTVTGAERYQLNFFHTVESATPSAQFRKGRVGQNTDEVIIDIPNAGPIFWEYYLRSGVGVLNANSNYFSIYTNDPPSEGAPAVRVEQLRGDNTCDIIAPPPPVPHSADLNKNFIIELSEILAVVEFINAGEFGCSGNNFVVDPSNQSCPPHDSDYNPQDWRINLPELLRLVQLYTAGAYDECIGGSEDGYCPVVD